MPPKSGPCDGPDTKGIARVRRDTGIKKHLRFFEVARHRSNAKTVVDFRLIIFFLKKIYGLGYCRGSGLPEEALHFIHQGHILLNSLVCGNSGSGMAGLVIALNDINQNKGRHNNHEKSKRKFQIIHV